MSNVVSNLMKYARMGIKIVADKHVSDLSVVDRTWRERLFTLPWTPFVKTKVVYSPKGYLMNDGSLIISPKTKRLLEDALLDMPGKIE